MALGLAQFIHIGWLRIRFIHALVGTLLHPHCFRLSIRRDGGGGVLLVLYNVFLKIFPVGFCLRFSHVSRVRAISSLKFLHPVLGVQSKAAPHP